MESGYPRFKRTCDTLSHIGYPETYLAQLPVPGDVVGAYPHVSRKCSLVTRNFFRFNPLYRRLLGMASRCRTKR